MAARFEWLDLRRPRPEPRRSIAGIFPGTTFTVSPWQPFAVKWEPLPPGWEHEPTKLRPIAGALFPGTTFTVSPWQPFAIKRTDPIEEYPHSPTLRPKPSPATFLGPARFVAAGPVQWDPQASVRSRRHQQLVAQILNSLVQRGELALLAPNTWVDGYVPGNAQKWAPGAPKTVAEALDRVAALLKVLNGGVGP